MIYCVDSVQCSLKRKRTPEIEEDEGVSLDEKRDQTGFEKRDGMFIN